MALPDALTLLRHAPSLGDEDYYPIAVDRMICPRCGADLSQIVSPDDLARFGSVPKAMCSPRIVFCSTPDCHWSGRVTFGRRLGGPDAPLHAESQ